MQWILSVFCLPNELVPDIIQKPNFCQKILAPLGLPRSIKAEQLGCLVQLASSFSKISGGLFGRILPESAPGEFSEATENPTREP